MMRQPTEDPYVWWRAALVDPKTPRHDGEPQAGYYRRRMVKNGPFLPVEVKLVQVVDTAGELSEPEFCIAEQLGDAVNPYAIWTHLRPIARDEFEALVSQHRNLDLMAATHVAVDLSTTAILPGGY